RFAQPRSEVDRMPAPPPRIPPPEIYPAPRSDRSLAYLLIGGGFGLALLVLCGLALAIMRGMPTSPSPVAQIPPASMPMPPPGTLPAVVVIATATPPPVASNVTVLAASEPPKLLAPQEYAAASQSLADGIAELNRAELKFIRDAKAAAFNRNQRPPGLTAPLLFAPDLVDDDLREVAARAFIVAQSADDLGRTAVAQSGGNDAAGQTAGHYSSIARLGYALVIDAQNLREGLQARMLARVDAINTIAEYGARLWNSGASDPLIQGNPFLPNVKDPTTSVPVQFLSGDAVAQLKTQMGAGKTVQTWLATSQEVVTKTVNLPAPRTRVSNTFDPNLLKTLTIASEQADADRARQVAAANLAMQSANPTSAPTQIQFAAFKSVSIADANQIAAGTVPSFANGKASALARQAAYPGGAEQFVGEMYLLNGQAPPRVEASTPVRETPPLVTLSIIGVKATSTMRDDQGFLGVAFQVQVAWQTTYAAPRLYIVCAGGSAGKIVTSNSGSQQLSAYAYVNSKTLPGEAEIRCEVHSPAGEFTTPNATAWTRVLVPETGKVEVTANPTDTMTSTPTLTPTKTPTPAATPTIIPVLGTEVAASKTAEFRATITEIARKTTQASQATVFTMNGTLSLNFLPVPPCGPGYDEPSFGTNTVGTIKITVDFKTGAANASLTGGGSRGTYTMAACDGSYSWSQTSRMDYAGTLNGTIDPATGALTLDGVTDLKYELSVSNCKYKDGRSCSISPRGGLPTKLPITIKGTVDKAARTGKGTVTVRNCMVQDHCVGDWSAGQ
ncbi:MAG: hypothetical protein KGJ80_06065, partial [Chloroflexota bacterium]|nr:hypothetical protein [Chloroflexota bacterium]